MGKLYGIGVGPGDPELLTLKAYKILQKADVIFCPEKKKGAGSFAFDIIKEHIKDCVGKQKPHGKQEYPFAQKPH